MTNNTVVVVSPDELRALIAGAVAEGLAGAALPPTPAAWLTTQEAADLIGVSRGTLDGLRSRGEGPPFKKIGRSVRYRREDLERACQVGPTPEQHRQARVAPGVPAFGAARSGTTSPRTAAPVRPTTAPPAAPPRTVLAAAPEDQYVTTKQAVKILRISAHMLYELCHGNAAVPHIRIGKTYQFKRADLLNADTGTEPWHRRVTEARQRRIPILSPEVEAAYVTEVEAAKILGVSWHTLDRLRRRDEGPPYVKLGRETRYRRADLEGSRDDLPPPEHVDGVRFYPAEKGWRQVLEREEALRLRKRSGDADVAVASAEAARLPGRQRV